MSLLLSELNYRPLQAVPRPFLGPGRYNNRIVSLGVGAWGVCSTERQLTRPQRAHVTLRRSIVILSSQEEWKPWVAAGWRMRLPTPPPGSFVSARKRSSSRMCGSSAPAGKGSEQGSLRLAHVWNESFNSLHPLLRTGRRRNPSMPAGFSLNKLWGLWKSLRSGATWTAWSVFLKYFSGSSKPPLHLASSRSSQIGQSEIPQGAERRDLGESRRKKNRRLCVAFVFPTITIMREITSLSWHLLCLDKFFFPGVASQE